MGSDIRITELLNSKNEILDNIIEGLKSWDGRLESGIEIIESNQYKLVSTMTINEELYELAGQFIDYESYFNKLNIIATEIDRIMKELKQLRKGIIKEKIALCKRDDLIESYITHNMESVFIDKDI